MIALLIIFFFIFGSVILNAIAGFIDDIDKNKK